MAAPAAALHANVVRLGESGWARRIDAREGVTHCCAGCTNGVYHSRVRLVLASASPRRCDLLRAAGYVFDVVPADIDETADVGEGAADYVQRLATAKARAIAQVCPDCLVLGADTTVCIDGLLLGKPADAEDARVMLRRLAGRAHDVFTGVSLVGPDFVWTGVEHTTVWIAELDEAEIADYVGSGEPFGKAGAYAIQGSASRFVTRIEGDYANVVGLPVALLHRRLRDAAPVAVSDARK